MNGYAVRNINLRLLGYSSYKAYLESDVWKVIRSEALGFRQKCTTCSRPSVLIHHRNYDLPTLMGGDVRTLVTSGALVPICKRCHTMIEFNANNAKVTLETANQRLDQLLEGRPMTETGMFEHRKLKSFWPKKRKTKKSNVRPKGVCQTKEDRQRLGLKGLWD